MGGREVHASASTGIALSVPGRSLAEEMLRNADTAMYRAKGACDVDYRIFDPSMYAEVLGRLELEGELRCALRREELSVHYQPKVSVDTGRIVEMEALVRWEHPERGLVLPSGFIAVAEEVDLILEIDRRVLREACRQVRRWQERYPSEPPLRANVNLSARQFRQPDLVEEVTQALRETGLDPASLEVEITESAVMEDPEAAVETLEALKRLGVLVAMDDFGTGYSSLAYLRRFPVDTLKIDRSFVRGIGTRPGDALLVSGIVGLGHALGMKVVAKGVQTREQLARLREMGCDLAQGFYFSRPLPVALVNDLLARGVLP